MTAKPLEGVRVLDLTQFYQGPYAAYLMAMAGAEVVKIEPIGGERTRRGGGADTPLAFAMLNGNKRSLTLDLKGARGRELFLALAEKTDVVIENFAPGTMDRLGLGWEVLRGLNPRLIYGTATGYGISGPDRDQLAMDHTIQAACGIMGLTGEADGLPARAAGQICDFMGGAHLYGALLTALLGRERTGHGTLVEIAMLETMYFSLASEYSHVQRTGELPPRQGAKSAANSAPYGRYQCRDGWVSMLCVSEAQWQSLLRLIGRADLADDPDYESGPKRHLREDEVNAMIEAWTGTRTRDEVYRGMREARIPVAPVRDLNEVMNDPHLHARGMLHRRTHPDMGDVVLPASPLRLHDYPAGEVALFAEPGADGAGVLADWLAMSAGDIDALRRDEVI